MGKRDNKIKQRINELEKKNKKHIILSIDRLILWATVYFGVVLGLIIVSSIIFFQIKIKDTEALLSKDKYREYKRYYVMIATDMEKDFMNNIYESARVEAEKSDAYIELLGSDLEEDYTKVDLFRMAINENVDGIIIEGEDSSEFSELVEEAYARGIPLVTISEDCKDTSLRKSFIGINKYVLGREYGRQLCEYIIKNKDKLEGEQAEVSILFNKSQLSSQSAILTAIQGKVSEEDKSNSIHITSRIIEDDSDYTSEEQINNIFKKQTKGESSKRPNVIICLSEINTVYAYLASRQFNNGRTEVFGYYMSTAIRNAIERGGIIKSTVVVDTEQMGEDAVDAMNEYLDTGNASDLYTSDLHVITNENIDSFDLKGGNNEKETK